MLANFVREGLVSWWAPALAFLAGLVSFASPCVMPLVPGYLSFISGVEAEDLASGERPRPRVLPALLFIAGFAAVFVTLGIFGSALLPLVRSRVGMAVAGGIVILFGLGLILSAFGRVGFAARESRPFLGRVRPGVGGAFPLGMAFAAGWTPCIGLVLGGILGIASASGGALRGAVLLLCYSLGLGIPFLLLALGLEWVMGRLAWVRRNYRPISGVAGVIMVAIGFLVMSGAWTRMLVPLSRIVPPL